MECGSSLQFDCAIRLLVHQHSSPALTAVMRGASFIGSATFLVPLGILVVAHYLWRGRRRTARLFAITVLGAEVLDQILKLAFHRIRPAAFFELPEPSGYSFPSGHSMVACAFYGALAVLAAGRAKTGAGRWTYRTVAALLIAVIALIGMSRIYLGVHYPSDVLGGYIMALIWLFAAASARRGIWRSYRD